MIERRVGLHDDVQEAAAELFDAPQPQADEAAQDESGELLRWNMLDSLCIYSSISLVCFAVLQYYSVHCWIHCSANII